MSILVKFFENKDAYSDVDVLGRVIDGDNKGMICFLSNKIKDTLEYVDQEVYCDIVLKRDRSLVVEPVSSSTKKSKYDINSIFKD